MHSMCQEGAAIPILERNNPFLKKHHSTPLMSSTRRFRGYCLGTPKSGTHSIAGLFTSAYASSHEPGVKEVIRHLLDWKRGRINENEVRSFLLARDEAFGLEMEASHPLARFAGILCELFPDAKVVLPIRDCYSWVHAYLDQQLYIDRQKGSHWMHLADFRHAQDVERGIVELTYAEEETVMAVNGLLPLRNYLRYWASHNQFVLDQVPEDRLVVVRTKEIGAAARRIEEFFELPTGSLNDSQSHLSRFDKKRREVLFAIDPDFVNHEVQTHCGELMDVYYPEITSMDNAFSSR